jgi:hypothetical protein
MPYTASLNTVNQKVAAGQLVDNGQCVALVENVASMPNTSHWQKGTQVQGDTNLTPGTVIATFDDNGRYENHTNGTSHAAIYVGQTSEGILVVDQWKGSHGRPDYPPHQRLIRFKNKKGNKVNQAENYYVVQ